MDQKFQIYDTNYFYVNKSNWIQNLVFFCIIAAHPYSNACD